MLKSEQGSSGRFLALSQGGKGLGHRCRTTDSFELQLPFPVSRSCGTGASSSSFPRSSLPMLVLRVSLEKAGKTKSCVIYYEAAVATVRGRRVL